jgi:hypothetical protein
MRDRLLLPLAIPVGALIVIAIVLFVMSRILLAVPHLVATPIALLVALAILLLATYSATRMDLTRGQLIGAAAALGVIVVASLPYLVLGAEGMATAIREAEAEAHERATLPPGTVVLTAAGFTNTFDKTKITFRGEGPYVVKFNNQDTGVLHNWALYQSRGGAVIFQGQNITGVASIDYTFPPPPAGTYFYQCDIHPQTMTGEATVEP